MRTLEYNEHTYRYAIKTIDNDFKNGIITGKQAKESIEKIRKLYQTGELKRNVEKAGLRDTKVI